MQKVKSSIHIQKANVYYILHSVRANDSYSRVFTDEKNEYLYTKETALTLYRQELKKRELAYNKRTGKKLHKNTVTLLSAIVNLEQHHTLEDVLKIAKYLEKTLDTKVVSIAIHKDEGKLINKATGEEFYSGVDFILNDTDGKLYWIDENKKIKEEVNLEEFEIVKNYHCHLEFLGLDSNGVAIKRNKLNKFYLSNLQTFVANSLGMQRGKNYYKTNTKAPKRLDVAQFKSKGVTKREAKKEVLAKIKNLKEKNKEMREQFKELGAKREDYSRLEQLNRELKEKIKAKNLTIEQMQEEFNKQLNMLKNKIENKEQENEQLEHKNKQLQEEKNTEIKQLQAKNTQLKQENSTLEQQVKELQQQNNQLKQDNTTLKEKITKLENKLTELEDRLNKLYKKAIRIVKKLWQKLMETRKKRDERQQQHQDPGQQLDIDTLIPALKKIKLYDEFLDEVESQKPEDYDEAIEWMEENEPYSDEEFIEYMKNNYTDEEIKGFVKEQEERERIKQMQMQQQEQSESWHYER